ncbi:MAG: hypothetical protein KGI97_05550, partial [Alphaproteobacteria bacterium]|nr:hypothetical protein [Alphaproteobacteria bacterium]
EKLRHVGFKKRIGKGLGHHASLRLTIAKTILADKRSKAGIQSPLRLINISTRVPCHAFFALHTKV